MAETGSASENPRIPESWSFTKALEPFKTEQIDVESGFLSISKPFSPDHDLDWMDYFVDREGSVLSSRDIVGQNVNACVRSSDVDFVVNNNWGKGLRWLSLTFKQREYLYSDEYDLLSEMVYSKTGKLMSITLGSRFAVERDGGAKNLVFAPAVRIGDILYDMDDMLGVQPPQPENGGIWRPIAPKERKGFKLRGVGKKELSFVDESGELAYGVNWKAEDGKLAVNQEHVESGVVKTLVAPLQIDMEEVNAVLFSKPPYPKEKIARVEGLEKVRVPWMEIQQIIGVSNEYSAPSKAKISA